ncbi:aminotransferase class I/II-fold pyridoxal phosphate-dependent enzyme [Lutibacter sp. A64]|uniref:aminotransferase class I/II-fold pyridoxal phosphate-dependent enzyme n=1 Tax=Lutibacter sp. A64 TaxID=2918526 RepID=UPI001F063509|nr:aminotransferase class I/II-fold pyridoxal phosphate-dependent enzyme [Lutibacter sp. A64]UMB55300.1 aminotransferase class I/II-fold pyridoxal phosphate-dependent enzyme [Lutibacter sp. A64]
MTINEFPSREITVNDKQYLYFGGTSYLGMASNKEFQTTIFEGLKKWGTFYGSSRSANIKLAIYNEAESYFSKFLEAEASLTISSGTLAGKMVVDYLSKSTKKFFHYPKTHPAVLHPNSLPLFLNGNINPLLQNNIAEDIVITTDAILALETTPTSFDFLDAITPQKNTTLVVDESHSLGIIGTDGKGVFSSIKSDKIHRKILISSLGKALGLSGGIIASDKNFVDAIRNQTLFVSSSGANPAYLEAFLKSKQLYKKQRTLLFNNLDFLASILKQNESFYFNKNYPVIYSTSDILHEKLLKNNIIIARFKYPTYENFMNRIVITANHTKSDLEKLAKTIN